MNNTHELDIEFLSKALSLAERGKYTCQPNPRVGCVIVKNGEIIGQGWHVNAGEGHAEVNAIKDTNENKHSTIGATAYVSLEPCSFTDKTPPCVDALIKAQISRVVCASFDPNPKVAGKGINFLISHGVDAFVTEDETILQQAELLNKGFFKRMRTGLPWVLLKSASSLDGKTADSQGQSKWITSREAREDVHRLRAESCAIVTGSGTQMADNPNLNARLFDASIRVKQPYRVLLDSELKLNSDANIIGTDNQLHVFSLNDIKPNWSDKATIHLVNGSHVDTTSGKKQETGKIDLPIVLETLSELEVNIVMIEAGSILAGAFLEAELVDEIVHYVAPSVIGSQGRDMFAFSKPLPLIMKKNFILSQVDTIGEDIKITYLKQTH